MHIWQEESIAFLDRCLLQDFGAARFFHDHFDRCHAFAERGAERLISELNFGAEAVDALVRSGRLREGRFDVIENGRASLQSFLKSGSKEMNGDAVFEAIDRGGSLRLFNVHREAPGVDIARRKIANAFGCEVLVNAYVTPPQKRGFDPHFDAHDVFIIQTEGEKRWSIFESTVASVKKPLQHQRFNRELDRPGEKIDEISLNEGDVLYIPRGVFHCAETGKKGSVHLTLGVHVITFATVLIETLAEYCDTNVEARWSSSPLSDYPVAKQAAAVAGFIEFLETTDFEAKFEACFEDFRSKAPRRPSIVERLGLGKS